jgi:tetratricopeptide (TPR) repeat protein
MKINSAAIAIFSLCLSITALGQPAKLEGHVYEIVNTKEIPVAGIRVIAPGSQSKETDSKGHFVIDFPKSVQPGQAARIEVNRPGWLVRDPLFGKCATQNTARNFELLKVIIVPKGSPLALEPKQMSKVIARWADERVKLSGQMTEMGRQLNEYAFLREYSEKFGFTLDQFKVAADQWAKIKESDDKEELALKEYWRKNYERAAQWAGESGDDAVEELKRINIERIVVGGNAVRRYQLEGNSFYQQHKFREAMAAYNKNENLFSARTIAKEDFPEEWALTKLLIGTAKVELGIRAEGEESQSLLGESVAAFREALKVYTRGQSPQDWTSTQNNLGVALGSRGERAEGADGVRLLREAVAAYREALKVYTREHSPQQWATTQNNLGAALKAQGERSRGEERVWLLGEAIDAYREALKVLTREHSPQLWATTQRNLGAALRSQGERAEDADGVRLLGEAVDAYSEALKVYTRERSPQQWAMTQYNLGAALRSQGERAEDADGARLLGEAVDAYSEALKVYTREHSPQQWVMTQYNLAEVYHLLRNWLGAAEAYANVLTLYPSDEEAYTISSSLYHQVLFRFEEAFTLNQQWLARHPNDISAQADFAEKHFTTARFEECERRINALLAVPEVSAGTKSALRAIEIADLLALNKADRISPKMEALIAEVSCQPAEFKVGWVFDGTRHFISQTEKLSPYCDWLDKLFDAIGGEDRETILKGLKEVEESFNLQRPNAPCGKAPEPRLCDHAGRSIRGSHSIRAYISPQ